MWGEGTTTGTEPLLVLLEGRKFSRSLEYTALPDNRAEPVFRSVPFVILAMSLRSTYNFVVLVVETIFLKFFFGPKPLIGGELKESFFALFAHTIFFAVGPNDPNGSMVVQLQDTTRFLFPLSSSLRVSLLCPVLFLFSSRFFVVCIALEILASLLSLFLLLSSSVSRLVCYDYLCVLKPTVLEKKRPCPKLTRKPVNSTRCPPTPLFAGTLLQLFLLCCSSLPSEHIVS